MIPPFPLYIDEITPDNIKATVSNSSTVFYNCRMMSLDMTDPYRTRLFNTSDGISIVPVGKFVCMLIRKNGSGSMIILDLVGKTDLAAKMAEKLNHVSLEEKFMQAYTEVLHHPERHNRYKLVLGNARSPTQHWQPDRS